MKRYFFLLCLLVLLKAALLIGLISSNYLGLGPDEAQYWTWSRHLDWGYYSKPPGIAWQIALTSYFLGPTELGVRFGAVVMGSALSLAVFFLALACQLQPRTAFWSGVTFALIPVGIMASFLSITDGGLVLFWTLGCIVIVSSLSKQQPPHYLLLGFCILGGALFKWPIYLLWALVVIGAWLEPQFRKKSLWAGIAISLLGLLPSLIWNRDHAWVTFKHVAGNIGGTSSAEVAQGNAGAFLGEQAALISPLLFVLLVLAGIDLFRRRNLYSKGLLFCGYSSLGILLGYAGMALFKKIQGNWCDFVYPAAVVFLCGYSFEIKSKMARWHQAGLVVALILTGVAFSIPWIQSRPAGFALHLPYKMNPFRHNVGWNNVSEALTQAGYDSESQFLFADKYQTCSILSFYGPQQQQAYFLNLQQSRLNQFSFWPSMAEEQQGKTGYFVVIENSPHMERLFPVLKEEYITLLQTYFSQVSFQGEYPLFFNQGHPVKAALLFKCVNYNGLEPPKVERY